MQLVRSVLNRGRGALQAAAAVLRGAPEKMAAPQTAYPMVTEASIATHQQSFFLDPVKPDIARIYMRQALAGDLYAQWELFSKMEEWDRLAKDLNEVKNAVRRLPWNVQPYIEPGADDPTESALAKAQLVEKALLNWEPAQATLEYGFDDFIYNALDAMGKGVSVQEIHWYERDGALLPRAAHLCTPRQYGWGPDGTAIGLVGGAAGWNSGGLYLPSSGAYGGRQVWQPFPENQFVVGFWQTRSGVPGATALLRCLVPYYLGVTYGWKWLMTTAQLFGIPFRWATYDENQPGLASKIADMLESMAASGYAVFPSGTTLDFKEAVTSASDNPQALILEVANKAVDLLVLGQELSSESKAAGLGSGNALLQGKVRQDVLTHAKSWMSELMNYQLVLPILRLNFGETSEPPRLVGDSSLDPDPLSMAQRDQLLVAMGMKVPSQFMYDRHQVPVPEDGEDCIEALAQPAMSGGQPGQQGDLTTDGTESADGEKPVKGRRAALPHGRGSVYASDATEKVIANALEDLTGVEAKWLGGIKPVFQELLAKAKDQSLSDADFLAAAKAVHDELPDLFNKLDMDALANALEASMGAACVNGAVRGFLARRAGAKQEPSGTVASGTLARAGGTPALPRTT